jgi:hypothetical protein
VDRSGRVRHALCRISAHMQGPGGGLREAGVREFRLHATGELWGPSVRSHAIPIALRQGRDRGDVYVCGHCGVILGEGEVAPEFIICHLCGVVNTSVVAEEASALEPRSTLITPYF